MVFQWLGQGYRETGWIFHGDNRDEMEFIDMVRRFWWSSFVHGIAIGQVPRVFGLVDERSSYCSIYPALEYRIDTVLQKKKKKKKKL
jgi:hypothetical protein